jgi:hypothetical protein
LLYFAAVLAVRTIRISLLTSGAKEIRTPDLLHAIWRQHVHPRPSPQVTVPTSTCAATSVPCVAVLPCCTGAIRAGGAVVARDGALTSVDPLPQATEPRRSVCIRSSRPPQPTPFTAPRNLSPASGIDSSPARRQTPRPDAPDVAHQLPLLADVRATGVAFFLARASPHAVVLPGVQRERQALPADRAARADRLCLRDLVKGGARPRDWEEQVGVSMPACGQLPPVPARDGDRLGAQRPG